MRAVVNPEKAAFYPRFFKAGPCECAEGDRFLGVSVPETRKIAHRYREMPFAEIRELLRDLAVEEAFLDKYAKTMPQTMLRDAIERFTPSKRKHYMAR